MYINKIFVNLFPWTNNAANNQAIDLIFKLKSDNNSINSKNQPNTDELLGDGDANYDPISAAFFARNLLPRQQQWIDSAGRLMPLLN